MHASHPVTPFAIQFLPCLRFVALVVTLALGLEWCQPFVALAQPNGTPSIAASNDELPPIQEAEKVEDRRPFYKKWWFWTIVGVVVAGAAVGIAAGGGGGGNGGSAPASPGNVNVKW